MPTTPEEWIEHNRQVRVTEGRSLAEQDMIQALAQVVVVDKISRALMGPVNSKGRSSFLFEGEPTEAEQHWTAMLAANRKEVQES